MSSATNGDSSRQFDVTHRMVLAIAGPMTLGLITVPLVGMVDMAVIGQLGDAALMGGIAVGALIFDFIATCFLFLRMGTTGLAAQALGAGDAVAQRAVIYRALIMALALGLATILMSSVIVAGALSLMGAGEAVNSAATRYIQVRLWAMPFSLGNFVIFGWLFGMGRSKPGLVMMVLLNSLNIGLTFWFVLGLGWNIEGAAWGTVAAEVIAFAAGMTVIWFMLREDWRIPLARLLNREAFARFMALNRDIFIRSFALLAAFAMFTSLSARQGDDILAANELLIHFFMIGGFFIDGIAIAAEQIVGRAIGAHCRPAFERAIKLTMLWGIALGAGLALVLWVCGPWLIDLLTTAPQVRLLANDYMIWAAITPLVASLAFQLDGVFVGATWSSEMRNVAVISTLGFILSFLVLMPLCANHGLWLALMVFLVLRGMGLLIMLPKRARSTF